MPRFSLSPIRNGDKDDSDSETSRDDEEDLGYSDDDEVQEEPVHPLGFASPTSRYTLYPEQESMQAYKIRHGYCELYDSGNENSPHPYTPPLYPQHYLNGETAPTSALLKYQFDRTRTPETGDDMGMDKLANLLQAATLVEARSPVQNLRPASFKGNPEMARQIASEVKVLQRRMEQEHLEAAKALKQLMQSNDRKARQMEADQQAKRAQEEEQAAAAAEKREAAAEALRKKEQAVKDKKEREEKQAADKLQAKKDAAAAATEYITRAEKLMKQLVQVRQSVEPFEKSKAVGKRRLGMKKIVNGKVNTLAENVEKIKQVAQEVAQAIQAAKDEDEQLKQQAAGGAAIPPEAMRGKRYLVDLLSSKVIVRVQAEGFNGQRGDGFPLASMLAAVSMESKDLGPVLAAHVYTVCPTAIPTLPHIRDDVSEDELMTKLGMQRGKDGSFETFERFLSRTEGVISLVADIMASEPSGHTLMGGHEGAVKWLSRFLGHLPSAPQSPLPLLTAPVLDAFLSGAGHMLANKHPKEFTKLLNSLTNDVVGRLDEGPIGKPSAIRLKKTIEGGFEGFKTKLPSRAMPELYLGANGSGGTHHGGSSAQTTSSTKGSAQNSSQSTIASPFGAPSSNTVASPFGGPSSNTIASPFGAPKSSTAASPFGAPSSSVPASPFGATQDTGGAKTLSGGSAASNPTPSPFGAPPQPMQRAESAMMGEMDSSVPAPSPYGATAPTPSPFGAPAPSPSPFGAPAPAPFGAPAPSPSPFGAPAPFGAAAPSPSPFGAPAPAPFGAAAPSPSPFGGPAPAPFGSPAPSSSPFGAAAPSPSPFGAAPAPFGAPAPSPSPFGAPAPSPSPFGAAAPSPSPFGAPAPSPSPFGAPAPSPFGGTAPAPFGAPATAPFGAAPSPSPFGGAAPSPSPFGAAAPSPSPFGAPAPSPFGGAAPAPFGAPAPNPSPFGAPAPSPSPFGAAASSPSPFGAAASSPSPFGSAAPSPSPFGAAAPSPSPFGAASSSFGAAPGPSPFSSGTSGGKDTRPPCKFFAQGRCKYGASCRNSHEAPQSGFGTFGGSSTPFGGPRR